jgi:hypothetical protein
MLFVEIGPVVLELFTKNTILGLKTICPGGRTLIISAPNHRPGAKFIHNIVRTRTYNVLEAQLPIPKTQRVAVIGPRTLNFSVQPSYLGPAATEWDFETFLG